MQAGGREGGQANLNAGGRAGGRAGAFECRQAGRVCGRIFNSAPKVLQLIPRSGGREPEAASERSPGCVKGQHRVRITCVEYDTCNVTDEGYTSSLQGEAWAVFLPLRQQVLQAFENNTRKQQP